MATKVDLELEAKDLKDEIKELRQEFVALKKEVSDKDEKRERVLGGTRHKLDAAVALLREYVGEGPPGDGDFGGRVRAFLDRVGKGV